MKAEIWQAAAEKKMGMFYIEQRKANIQLASSWWETWVPAYFMCCP
jgi:hypothetical protein